jgi:catechol 2,3-dioxygenase
MPTPPRARFSHLGLHVHDIDRMIAFYTELMGLEVTDSGVLNIPGKPRIAFLSSDPQEHHQLALVEGRSDGVGNEKAAVLNQISFRVDDLEALRDMKRAAAAAGVARFLPLNHGNAWAIYFDDPEGNAVEVFTGSPLHVRQPVTDGLDLAESDAQIVDRTEQVYAAREGSSSAAQWRDAFARRLEERWGNG